MKCKSCSGDVPSKFSHSISTNTCPFCGNQIMDEELRSALSSIEQSMKCMEKYQNEILDWLKSKFSLVREDEIRSKITQELALSRVASNTLAQNPYEGGVISDGFHSDNDAVKFDENGNQISGKPLQDPEVTNKFLKNAGISNRNNKLKDLVKQIKKDAIKTKHMVSPDDMENISISDVGNMDPEDIEQLESVISGGYGTASSAISGSEDSYYEDDIPAQVLHMANSRATNSKDYSHKDVMQLQRINGKSAQLKSEISKSGGVGLIRR